MIFVIIYKKVYELKENEIKKILIIRLSALGDTIHTLPLAYSLKKQYPNLKLDWIVEDKAAKFIVNNPLLDNVYVLEKKKWKNLTFFAKLNEFFKIIKKIRLEKYDVVIDTQQLFKSSIIMGFSKGKRKIALDYGRELSSIFANEIIKTGRKQFDTNFHVVKRNLEIAYYLGCDNITEPKFIIPDFKDDYSEDIENIIDKLEKTKKTIVIAPATTWENKHWTIQGWIDVINEFKNEFNIVVTAAENEKTLTSKILSKISDGNIFDLSGKTTLNDLVNIYKNADIIISPDSGSAHIAWAVQKPEIITLFFATSANRTAPYGEKYYFLQSDIPCSPCMKKHCRQKKLLNCCNKGIESKKVINLVKKVLQ